MTQRPLLFPCSSHTTLPGLLGIVAAPTQLEGPCGHPTPACSPQIRRFGVRSNISREDDPTQQPENGGLQSSLIPAVEHKKLFNPKGNTHSKCLAKALQATCLHFYIWPTHRCWRSAGSVHGFKDGMQRRTDLEEQRNLEAKENTMRRRRISEHIMSNWRRRGVVHYSEPLIWLKPPFGRNPIVFSLQKMGLPSSNFSAKHATDSFDKTYPSWN